MNKIYLKRIATLALAFTLALGIAAHNTKATTFSDVPSNHWAYAYIQEMADKGIMKGTGNGAFSPNGTLTVAEFSMMIARAFWPGAMETVAATSTSNEWWWDAVEAVRQKGGFDSNILMVDYPLANAVGEWPKAVKGIAAKDLNRYQMAAMVYDLMKAKGITFSEADEAAGKAQLTDYDSIPPLYAWSVPRVVSTGVLTGKTGGMFAGNDTLTRAEAAAVMSRLLGKNIQPDKVVVPTPTPTPTPTPAPTPNGDSYTPASSVNGKKPTVGKSDQYPTKGGAMTLVNDEGYMAGHGREERLAAAQGISPNGYRTGANVDIGNAQLVYELLARVNEMRAKGGMAPLQWVTCDAAEEFTLLRAHEITLHFSHGRTGGDIGGDEVIARGQGSPKEVIEAWANSPGHYDSLMRENKNFMCAVKCNNCWIITLWTGEYDFQRVEWFAPNNYVEAY